MLPTLKCKSHSLPFSNVEIYNLLMRCTGKTLNGFKTLIFGINF